MPAPKDKQFKIDAVRYRLDHPDLNLKQCATNLGVGHSTLAEWVRAYKKSGENMAFPGSGNYASEEQREIARLKRELRDTKDALDVLKKAISILGEK